MKTFQPIWEEISERVFLCKHAVVADKICTMRDKTTEPWIMRMVAEETAGIMFSLLSNDLPVTEVIVDTPVADNATAWKLENGRIAIAPIIRAGTLMEEGIHRVIPTAQTFHVGVYRDHETLVAHQYYDKRFVKAEKCLIYVTDPMLATGNSAVKAISHFKEKMNCHENLSFMCFFAAPEGIKALHAAHPDVNIWTAAIDKGLTENGYINPGCGDFGDRGFNAYDAGDEEPVLGTASYEAP